MNVTQDIVSLVLFVILPNHSNIPYHMIPL